jgi:hypothetical protein
MEERFLVRSLSIRGIALAGAVFFSAVLAGCATQPEMPQVQTTRETRVPFQTAMPPVKPEPVAQPPVTASINPLDATRLPPFDGEKREMKEALRGVPTVDRTVQPDDLWERIRAGFSMPNLEGRVVCSAT